MRRASFTLNCMMVGLVGGWRECEDADLYYTKTAVILIVGSARYLPAVYVMISMMTAVSRGLVDRHENRGHHCSTIAYNLGSERSACILCAPASSNRRQHLARNGS